MKAVDRNDAAAPSAEAAALDFSSFDALTEAQEDGVDVQLTHPVTGDPIDGAVIRVAGPDSKRARDAQRAMYQRRSKGRRVTQLSGAEVEEELMSSLAQQVISWRGIIVDREPVELTPASAVRLFKRFRFIFEQVNLAAGDRAGFSPT